ncbi:MAG: ABC transporter permease [bacterium]|nr:ABC transporter permease [bacterium]
MMLYKLSLANIKKSVKDYAIYFFTLILGVCIFYVFNSLDSQTAMIDVSKETKQIIGLLLTVIKFLSVFVAFILGFLIIYASRFLIKKRNKEFGVYITLGMSKRKISTLLLLETFIIGLISLVVGLAIGVLVSQITSIFVANLFEADMTKFTFIFSKSALIKTIIYFGIIYFVVMLFNTIMINKCKLIDLLQTSKKTEKIKLKNPILSIVLFIISVILLGGAYYLVTAGFYKILYKYDVSILLVPIIMGVVGTVLFFYSVAGMLLRIISKCKNIYYKGLNSFIFKNISSKINTMVISISIICIMLFFTICLLSSALSIKNYFNDSLNKYAPADVEICLDYSENAIDDIEAFYKENGIYDKISQLVSVKTYEDINFDYGKSLGKNYEKTKEMYPFVRYNETVEVMSLTDYNNLSKIMKLETIKLQDDEYAIVSNYESYLYDETMNMNSILNIFGYDLKPYANKTLDGDYWLNGNAANLGFFVVPDKIIESKTYKYNYVIVNYITKDKEEQKVLNEKIFNLSYPVESTYYTSKLEVKDNSVGISALVTFIGLYLGIIFLISSAAILSLKELSDSLDDKDKYRMLRNIGTDEAMINKAIFKQTLIFFLLPLSLALIHTIFGIKFCLIILESIGVYSLAKAIITTLIIIIIIYGGYFLITYICNKNIIKDRI